MPEPTRIYVTNQAWHRTAGRPDLIDEIADQFERPVAGPRSQARGVPDGTDADTTSRWPRRSRGWRSAGRLHPRSGERQVS